MKHSWASGEFKSNGFYLILKIEMHQNSWFTFENKTRLWIHTTKKRDKSYALRTIYLYTDYGHTMVKSLILCGPNSNPNKYLGFGYKGLVFCRNNDWLIENMDKGLTVQKWVLINCLKMPKTCICPNCLPKSKRLGFWWKMV